MFHPLTHATLVAQRLYGQIDAVDGVSALNGDAVHGNARGGIYHQRAIVKQFNRTVGRQYAVNEEAVGCKVAGSIAVADNILVPKPFNGKINAALAGFFHNVNVGHPVRVVSCSGHHLADNAECAQNDNDRNQHEYHRNTGLVFAPVFHK